MDEKHGYLEEFDLPTWPDDKVTWLVPSGIIAFLYIIWKGGLILLNGLLILKHILFWMLVLIPTVLKQKCERKNWFVRLFG